VDIFTCKISLPAWSFLPIKIGLLLLLLLPAFFWVGHINQKTESLASLDTAPVTTNDNDAVAEPPQAASSWLKGIDVSHFQGQIKWHNVSQSGIKFAFAKATGGMAYVDPQFANNWHGMRANDVLRGAYHYYYAADDATKQAQHFLQTVGPMTVSDLPPVLDVEILDNVAASKLVAGVLVWLQEVEKATGRKPIIYSDLSFAIEYLSDNRLKGYYLWIADYEKKPQTLPQPWQASGWHFWQYSESSIVQGVDGEVDMDYFQGDKAALQQLIAASQV